MGRPTVKTTPSPPTDQQWTRRSHRATPDGEDAAEARATPAPPTWPDCGPVGRPARERPRTPGATGSSGLTATTDGTAAEDGLVDSVDRVAAFAPAILVIRWGTTIASLALSATYIADTTTGPSPSGAAWSSPTPSSAPPARSATRGNVRSLLGSSPRSCSWCSPCAPPATGTRRSSSRCSPPSPWPASPGDSASPCASASLASVMVSIPFVVLDRTDAARHPRVGAVEPGAAAGRPHRRLRPPDLRRGRPPALPRPRPPRPARRRQRPALLAAPRHPDPARPRSTSTRCSTRPSAASGACSTSTSPPSWSSTTPTATGRSSAARAPACPRIGSRATSPARCAGPSRSRRWSACPTSPSPGRPGLAPKASSGLYAVLPARGRSSA